MTNVAIFGNTLSIPCMRYAVWTTVVIMQATERVAAQIRSELAWRRMSVETLASTLLVTGTSQPVMSFRTLCRRLANPGEFRLDELEAIAQFFNLELDALVNPQGRRAA